MKVKPFNIFIAVALLAIVGGFVFLKDGLVNLNSSPSERPEILMDTLSYMNYSEANLGVAKSKGRPILFFAATLWCQTCSELEKEILERQSEIPSDTIILKVDYDNDKAMNQKWGVTSQHTLVVLNKDGQEVKRWLGGGFDTMLQQMKEF